MKTLTQGMLIAIEGIDGSGKSLLCQNLYKKLQPLLPVILTKEPGGSELGSIIRQLLQHQPIAIDSKAEFLLFAADRAQHFSTTIIPALQEKKVIISDRMADSSLAYQGYGRSLGTDMINTINQWAMQGITPDITIYVRVDIHTAIERLNTHRTTLTAFEKIEFLTKVLAGFEEIFHNRKDVLIVDGCKKPQEILEEVFQHITHYLHDKK